MGLYTDKMRDEQSAKANALLKELFGAAPGYPSLIDDLRSAFRLVENVTARAAESGRDYVSELLEARDGLECAIEDEEYYQSKSEG